jgi:uncharacterized protein (DUF362 family)
MNIYVQQTQDRAGFVARIWERLELSKHIAGKRVLLKPNVVSHEPYPTTTHPAVLESCLKLLQPHARELLVADGPAPDAGDTRRIIENHPLRQVCRKFGVELVDLLHLGMKKVRTGSGFELELSAVVFHYDFILSLPVLKSHAICEFTGALKNQFGLLSSRERMRLHFHKDIHRGIAELNTLIRPHFYIIDAVQTLINTNEVRHGGKPRELGYMLAGADPVALDISGLELLQQVEPRLAGKRWQDIPYLKHSADLGVGEARYEMIPIETLSTPGLPAHQPSPGTG